MLENQDFLCHNNKFNSPNVHTSVVLVSIRQILLVIVLFLESGLVLGGSNTCK